MQLGPGRAGGARSALSCEFFEKEYKKKEVNLMFIRMKWMFVFLIYDKNLIVLSIYAHNPS